MHRGAIIGSGGRGHAHAEAYKHVADAECVACCDVSLERAEALAGKFGLRAYADPAEMIRREKPDLVHVVTPPSARVDLMRLVSELGVPACTVEKPICLGVEDWRALTELAGATRTKFAVCHQFHWYPLLVRCREAVERGAIGKVRLIEATAGMNVVNQGTHALHYGNSLNGDREIVEVFGAVAGMEKVDVSHPGPESTFGLIAFDDGARMTWQIGPGAPRVGDPTTTWQHVRVAAYGETGHVLWEEFGRWEIVNAEGAETGRLASQDDWARDNLVAQAAFYADVLAWLDGRRGPVSTNLDRSLHEWKAVLALYESALSHRVVALGDFRPSSDLMQRLNAALQAAEKE